MYSLLHCRKVLGVAGDILAHSPQLGHHLQKQTSAQLLVSVRVEYLRARSGRQPAVPARVTNIKITFFQKWQMDCARMVNLSHFMLFQFLTDGGGTRYPSGRDWSRRCEARLVSTANLDITKWTASPEDYGVVTSRSREWRKSIKSYNYRTTSTAVHVVPISVDLNMNFVSRLFSGTFWGGSFFYILA